MFLHCLTIILTLSLLRLTLADPLATITPCPNASPDINSPSPITVSSQYQEVSTCISKSLCFRSVCRETQTYSTWKYVSTAIPCEWDGSATKSTVVTDTAQLVTISTFVTTKTVYPSHSTNSSEIYWYNATGTQIGPNLAYSTIARNYVVPYNKIGPLAIPDYPGSGLCDECDQQADGSREQLVTVTECTSGADGPRCVRYMQHWVSRPSPSTSQTTAVAVSTSTVAAVPGNYTFVFSHLAPPQTFTDASTTWTAGPHPFIVSITKPCTQTSQTIDIATTVMKTITYTVAPSVRPGSKTTSCPFPTEPRGFPGFHLPSTAASPVASITVATVGDPQSDALRSTTSRSDSSSSTISASAEEWLGAQWVEWTTSSPSRVAPASSITISSSVLWAGWTATSSLRSVAPTSLITTTSATWVEWTIVSSPSALVPTFGNLLSSTGWGDWPPTSTTLNSVLSSTTPGTTSTATTPCAASSVTGPSSTFTPDNAALFYIELQQLGLRYHKRAPSYIKFDGDDGYLTTQKTEAALFYLLGDLLFHESKFIGSWAREGSAVFEQLEVFQDTVRGWSRNGDDLTFIPARLGFCVTQSSSVFVLLTTSPAFQCASYRLRVENQDGTHPSPTASTTGATTPPSSTTQSTTTHTPDISADMDDEPPLTTDTL